MPIDHTKLHQEYADAGLIIEGVNFDGSPRFLTMTQDEVDTAAAKIELAEDYKGDKEKGLEWLGKVPQEVTKKNQVIAEKVLEDHLIG